MPVEPLTPDKLRRQCPPELFTFKTTADLESEHTIIGQPRGTDAIDFGIGIHSRGYNIFVLGAPGTGRTTTIKRFLDERTLEEPTPLDWVYVNNFTHSHQPRAIELPAGEGERFRSRIQSLIAAIREELPKAFASEAYRETVVDIRRELEKQQEKRLDALQEQAQAQGFAIVRTAAGLAAAPISEGKVMPQDVYAALSVEEQHRLEATRETLEQALEEALDEVRGLEQAARQDIEGLDRHVAEASVEHHFAEYAGMYADQAEVQLFLQEVHDDVLENLVDFHGTRPEGHEVDWRRYAVNLFVDHRDTVGAPVIIEDNPTYAHLLGRIEYEMRFGVLTTHFTNLRAGSLHRANGGYIVISATDLLRHPAAWAGLERALKSEQIRQQVRETSQAMTKSIDPEPIPLDLKVILVGTPQLYYALYDNDDSFRDLFKVKADFDTEMPRSDANIQRYAQFVSRLCRAEDLPHFDRTAVARIVEFGSRLSEHQERLSTEFGLVADLIREAGFWSRRNTHDIVTAEDVARALVERRRRSNKVEEHLRREVAEGTVLLSLDGMAVGQLNGLSVLDYGDYAFGIPGRITARTYMGEAGVVNIEREVDMSGPLHNKGLLTLVGYIGGQYALHQPLSLSASLTFEQNYANIDGDSAAMAELLALLSSVGELPLDQGIAITGSVNQRGDVQPIGGVSEKIEGFYDTCQAVGLTGRQGVIIPASNVPMLMLDPEVVAAVAAGTFHIWPVKTVDEAITILMGRTAGQRDDSGAFPPESVHAIVQQRLLALARDLKSFGDDEEE